MTTAIKKKKVTEVKMNFKTENDHQNLWMKDGKKINCIVYFLQLTSHPPGPEVDLSATNLTTPAATAPQLQVMVSLKTNIFP